MQKGEFIRISSLAFFWFFLPYQTFFKWHDLSYLTLLAKIFFFIYPGHLVYLFIQMDHGMELLWEGGEEEEGRGNVSLLCEC